jgi:hypothetical protein
MLTGLLARPIVRLCLCVRHDVKHNVDICVRMIFHW